MGRVRGKGNKKSSNGARDDAGKGEEDNVVVNVPVRRRGRPQKPLKDDIDEEVEKTEEDESEGGGGKSCVLNKDVKKQGRKRKSSSQSKENSGSFTEEKGVEKTKEGSKALGFRQIGSRRKNNKPHRAAEVGVECK